jgi:hypothetical protein
MRGKLPVESVLPTVVNGPLQWFTLLAVIWGLLEAIRFVWIHAK